MDTEEFSTSGSGRLGQIVIAAYHFFPSSEVGAKRMNALAASLQRLGRSVTVLSRFDGLETLVTNTRPNLLYGLQIRQIPDPPSRLLAVLVKGKRAVRAGMAKLKISNRMRPGGEVAQNDRKGGSPRRWFFEVLHVLDDKKRWSIRLWRLMQQVVPRNTPALVIVSGPPMSSVLAGTAAAHFLGKPVIVDLRDPIVGEREPHATGRPIPNQWARRFTEKYVVRRAHTVVTTSPTLQRRLQSRYPAVKDRIVCICNGFDEPALPALPHTGNRLVIVYAGALYLNRDPFPFLEALGFLLDHEGVDATRIEVVFAGDCEEYGGIRLRDWLAKKSWGTVVKVLPCISSEELKVLYARATLLLNFSQGQRMQVPAKTFELLGLGREVLVICEEESDTATIIDGIEGVSWVSPDDERGMRELVLDVYRRHVEFGTLRAPPQEQIVRFSRDAQNARYLAVIETASAVHQAKKGRGAPDASA